ncbi:hypothetical protein 010DV004_219 [Bacillus phage 010DV004]|nr:hypothetical protein 010DV004_219 [Bacillus phage 010DV004]QZA69431.1 hypothetical protein 010DV005_219 [Bacillus phage 010DV005]QZA70001.1 hypothetical protein 043JT007_220 [Bacillus phage 043JT007]
MLGRSETPTEKHRDAVVDHLDYLLELASYGKYSEYVTIEMLKALKDMASYVYDSQIEQEHRDRQYQAAEDAMDEICTDPDMW